MHMSRILFASLASAQTLTGTVKNATTGKPAAGDEVVLLSLGQGMEEAGRTKADAKGNFSFKLDAQGPHLVRVIHQEVTYHRMAPPGTTSVEVEVYDVGKKVDGIEVVADIMRFQAGQGQLQVERTFAVNNNSKPPRTQMNEHNLRVLCARWRHRQRRPGHDRRWPAGEVRARSRRREAKNRYAFLFPLRPGETRFNVVYTVPYTGSVNIDPKSVYPLQHFVAIAPKSMEFSAAPGANFSIDALSRPARRQCGSGFQRRTGPAPRLSNFRVKVRSRRLPKTVANQPGRSASAQNENPSRRRPRTAHRRSRSSAEISLVDPRRIRRRPHHRRNLRSLAPASRQSRRPLRKRLTCLGR